MPEYLSPGVYVEEVPSVIKPIAGVSTSTAAFVGAVPELIQIPEENPAYDPNRPLGPDNASYRVQPFPFPQDRVDTARGALEALAIKGANGTVALPLRPTDNTAAGMANFRRAQEEYATAESRFQASDLAPEGHPVLCTTFAEFTRHFGAFSLDGLPPVAPGWPGGPPAAAGGGAAGPAGAAPGAGGAAAAGAAPPPGQSQLAHAVFAFFNNGGTRCYVMRYADWKRLREPLSLAPLEAIDEISLVAAPGFTDEGVQANIVTHCENMGERFGILDGHFEVAQGEDLTVTAIRTANNTNYGALYFPWIKVFDRATQLTQPDGDGDIFVAPSGAMAGIYSRVDHERGVHKAPANEVVRGALGTKYRISRNLQDGLNPLGINCIREINDNITVWGARTLGGDKNLDLKYINVRRTLIFLRKSIDQGTQWVVFEPNEYSLWAKIVRNVTAFLTVVWRDGALFGASPAEAFYVKCDAETNPPENRELGRVTTEIGVAIVRPAEFVIFRISQWAGQTTS